MTTTNDAPAAAPSKLVKKLENAAELLAMNDAFGGVQLVIAEAIAALASDASPRGEAVRQWRWRYRNGESNAWRDWKDGDPVVPFAEWDTNLYVWETRVLYAHPAPATVESWQDIASAPKDGTAFFGIGPDDAYPQAMRWQAYSADEIEEIGEPGYWSYCEDLIGDVTGSASPLHWRPMFPLPAAALAPATEGRKG